MPSDDLETNPMSHRSPDDTFRPASTARPSHGEGTWTRVVEQQTAKIPSSAFLTVALGAMAASLLFELAGNSRASRFVGMWPPTLLIAGVYNKLVKTFGTA
jgi:hypothetical protein